MNIFESGWHTRHRVLLPLTDTVVYVLAAGGLSKTFYHNLTYAPCLAHGLHAVTEEVRGTLSHVDKLISSENKLFVRAPWRVATSGEKLQKHRCLHITCCSGGAQSLEAATGTAKGTVNGFPAGYALFIRLAQSIYGAVA
jgi:hypothetical protein